jgi:hypothetical protein
LVAGSFTSSADAALLVGSVLMIVESPVTVKGFEGAGEWASAVMFAGGVELAGAGSGGKSSRAGKSGSFIVVGVLWSGLAAVGGFDAAGFSDSEGNGGRSCAASGVSVWTAGAGVDSLDPVACGVIEGVGLPRSGGSGGKSSSVRDANG